MRSSLVRLKLCVTSVVAGPTGAEGRYTHRAACVRVLSENTGYIHHILDILGYLDVCFFGRIELRGKEEGARIR